MREVFQAGLIIIALAAFTMASAAQPAASDSISPPTIAYVCHGEFDKMDPDAGLSVIDLRSGNQTRLLSSVPLPAHIVLSGDERWLYVLHAEGGLSRVAMGNMTLVDTIQLDVWPHDLAVSPDGTCIYVSGEKYGKSHVIVADAENFRVIRDYPVESDVSELVVSPDGARICLATSRFATPSSPLYYPDNNVLVINAHNGTRTDTIRAGVAPEAIAFSPDGSRLYVANKKSDNVTVIDVATGRKVASIPTGRSPVALIVSPGGDRLYIVNDYYDSSFFTSVDTSDYRILSSVDLQAYSPGAIEETTDKQIVLSPDGSRAYVTNPTACSISVVDTVTGSVVATVTVNSTPCGLSMAKYSPRLYVACKGSQDIVAIDTDRLTVASEARWTSNCRYAAFSPDGRRAYITDMVAGTVLVINATDHETITTVDVGGSPQSIVISPDGGKAYVGNYKTGSINVVDLVNNSRAADIKVDAAPEAVSPDSSTLYAIDSDAFVSNLVAIDTRSMKVVRTTALHGWVGRIALNSDGGRIYTTCGEISNDDYTDLCTIDTGSFAVSKTRIQGKLGGAQVTQDGRQVYLLNSSSNELLCLDTSSGRREKSIPLPVKARQVVLTADGSSAYVTSGSGVAEVDLDASRSGRQFMLGNAMTIAVPPAPPSNDSPAETGARSAIGEIAGIDLTIVSLAGIVIILAIASGIGAWIVLKKRIK